MKKILLTAVVALLGLAACNNKQFPQSSTSIQATQLQEMIAKNKVIVIDVRTEGEYTSGHIPGAANFDVLQESNFLQQIQPLNPNKSYVLVCQSGRRSKTAMRLMQEKGFKKLVDLDGGMNGWKGNTEK